MKRILLSASAIVLIYTMSVIAQGVAAPFTPRLQTVFTGLSRPILVKSAPDNSGRLFVLQQGGQIRVFQPGASTSTVFIDASSRINPPTTTGDERGLLGLAFHPDFASNGKFYCFFNRAGDSANTLVEYTTTTGTGSSNTANVSSERLLFSIPDPFTNHNGGNLNFGPDGYLYIGTGDGGSANDPGARAQNRSQLLGKILRIDVNSTSPAYAIPADNPYTGTGTARCDTGSTTAGNLCQEIWAYGMRNPWRWSFDRGGTHQLFVADVGESAIEELDIIQKGGNYGWRVYEGNNCTGNDPSLCSNGANPITQMPPYYTYSHSAGRCAVTGGYVYRGQLGSLPNGMYVFGDYCSGEIWYLPAGSSSTSATLLQDTPRSVVSFGEDNNGEIYVCYNNGQIDKITRAKASADFDGDLKSDLAVYRPTDTNWYVLNSSNNSFKAVQFGAATDIPVPEDYDGDNITDIGVFRPSTGSWFYMRSGDNTFGAANFGSDGDIPAAGDYDGDAKADLTVFRPANGVWYTTRSSDSGFRAVQFGLDGDIPAAGDYDGDGKYDLCVFRPGNGVWYRLGSLDQGFSAIGFGLNGDIPSPADMDGDGKLDTVVYRPSTGIWYSLLSTTGGFQARSFGLNGDIPVVGDYDGDGKDDIAVFRPASGTWYALQSSNGALKAASFGTTGDIPIPKYDIP